MLIIIVNLVINIGFLFLIEIIYQCINGKKNSLVILDFLIFGMGQGRFVNSYICCKKMFRCLWCQLIDVLYFNLGKIISLCEY